MQGDDFGRKKQKAYFKKFAVFSTTNSNNFKDNTKRSKYIANNRYNKAS